MLGYSTNVLLMKSKKSFSTALKFTSLYLKYSELEYLEDPTYQPSWGSMVCLTCNKFSFKKDEKFGSLLYCDFHKKLIFHGEHLTHSCEIYKKKSIFGIQKISNHNKVA